MCFAKEISEMFYEKRYSKKGVIRFFHHNNVFFLIFAENMLPTKFFKSRNKSRKISKYFYPFINLPNEEFHSVLNLSSRI